MSGSEERCGWNYHSRQEKEYHDRRWCRPVHDEQELYAMLCLEGMQAGLSWSLILRREKAIRKAFDGLDPQRVARYDEVRIEEILQDPSVIRSRAKVRAVVSNAQAFLRLEEEEGSFDRWIWSFTGGKVLVHHPRSLQEIPAKTELSERVSRQLKERGFRFVGPVITYSYLQAVGIVNDHLDSCPYKYAGGSKRRGK